VPDIHYKTLEEEGVYTLLIIEANPNDSDTYECVAINSAGEARCDAELLVQGPTVLSPTPATNGDETAAPTLVDSLKDQTVNEGQSVHFQCKVNASPSEKFAHILNIFEQLIFLKKIKDNTF
jgi:titin